MSRRTTYLFGVGLLFTVALCLLLIYLSKYNSCAYRIDSALVRIKCALDAYHDTYGCFPPQVTVDRNGNSLHSWRTLILPFLGEDSLYSSVRLDEAWNSPANIGFSRSTPAAFKSCDTMLPNGQTPFVGVEGISTTWPGSYSLVRDNCLNKDAIQLIYAPKSSVCWSCPRDFELASDDSSGVEMLVGQWRNSKPTIMSILLSGVLHKTALSDARTNYKYFKSSLSTGLRFPSDAFAWREVTRSPADSDRTNLGEAIKVAWSASERVDQDRSIVWLAVADLVNPNTTGGMYLGDGDIAKSVALDWLAGRYGILRSREGEANIAHVDLWQGTVGELRANQRFQQKVRSSGDFVLSPNANHRSAATVALTVRAPFRPPFDSLLGGMQFRDRAGKSATVKGWGILDRPLDVHMGPDPRTNAFAMHYVGPGEFLISIRTQRDGVISIGRQEGLKTVSDIKAMVCRYQDGNFELADRQLRKIDEVSIPNLSFRVSDIKSHPTSGAAFGLSCALELDESGMKVDVFEFLALLGKEVVPRRFICDGPFFVCAQAKKDKPPFLIVMVNDIAPLLPNKLAK